MRSNSSLDSLARAILGEQVSPWVMAFWADFALPSGVTGPRDLDPLTRADSARVSMVWFLRV